MSSRILLRDPLKKEQTANSTVWLYACSVVYIEREREKERVRDTEND